MIIPTNISERNVLKWVMSFAGDVTIADVLRTEITEPTQIDVLLLLLKVLRAAVRDAKVVMRGRPENRELTKQVMESTLRGEVHDTPDRFNFNPVFLREISPIHVAEMIRIVLAKLLKEGIDASKMDASPEVGGMKITSKESLN